MRAWRRVISIGLLALGPTVGAARGGAQAQQIALADRGPRFLFAPKPDVAPRPVDARSAPLLRQQVALDLDGVTVADALAAITRQTGVAFVYSRDVLSTDARVHLRAERITVAAALTEILLDAGVDVLISSSSQAALVKRPPAVQVAAGAIVGRVTDAKTQTALGGATITVEGTSRAATTGSDGRYRIREVAPGTYTVRARYIGYAPGMASVTVSADQEATADFVLEKSAQPLDEVVTTGTLVPTAVKALPTPVSVISDSDITLQRPQTVMQLFRQAVPTAVSWDQVNNPYFTAFSVRGASTFAGQIGQMKVFVDGIEVANTSVATVDPSSIERVEVIRGPQAAAIYGSGAIGGVIQFFTKRGDQSINHPQVDAQTALGVMQTPYAGFGGVLRQRYTASIRGGASDVSYNLGASYSHLGDYLPNGELSKQSSPSFYGGMRFTRGLVSLDVSGRYYTQNVPAVLDPRLAATGFSFAAKPAFEAQQVQNQTMGARLVVSAARWWQHTVTLGLDRYMLDFANTQARLTFPGDTLLAVFHSNEIKSSIGYNTSLQGSLGPGVSGSLTLGLDHWSLPIDRFFSFGALTTTGTIQTATGQSISAQRTVTNNTGYFAQGQIGLRDALFLTGGVRAEKNSDFGDSLGTPVSPRVGLSYVQRVSGATLKVRSSYGRAIRAPAPGQKLASVGGGIQTVLPSPQLGPERQKGWDAGLDAFFGDRGSLSVTYYDQTAEDLIQTVQVAITPAPTFQAQNIGRVRNTGVEIEGRVIAGPLELKGQYGYARSRVEQLAPGYTGDLRPGDQSLMTPKHTAGASATLSPIHGTTVAVGLTYVGSWSNYDYFAEFACFGGTGTCQPTTRGYITSYSGFVKMNAAVWQKITPFLSGFVSMDNLTNNEAYELDNLSPVTGRTTTVGLRLSY